MIVKANVNLEFNSSYSVGAREALNVQCAGNQLA